MVAKWFGEALAEGFASPIIVAEAVVTNQNVGTAKNRGSQFSCNSPKETAYNMFQQSNSLLFDELGDHIAKNSANSIKPFVRGTDIRQANIIEEDLLYDKDCHSLAQL